MSLKQRKSYTDFLDILEDKYSICIFYGYDDNNAYLVPNNKNVYSK